MFNSYHKAFKKYSLILLFLSISMSAFVNKAYSQAEVEPWGNITGIRKHGQLFNFESAINVASADGKRIVGTALEKQRPHFKRNGDEQIVNTNIDSLFFTETVKDLSAGKIRITINLNAHKDTVLTGVYFCITLPNYDYKEGQVRFFGVKSPLGDFAAIGRNYDATAKGLEFK